MRDVKPSADALQPSGFSVLKVSRAHYGFEPKAPLPDQPPTKVLSHDPSPRQLQLGTAMNDALDLHEITTVLAVALSDSENGADERGWWPVIALTDEAHPIVFACNLN
jgi:hypothetical protein